MINKGRWIEAAFAGMLILYFSGAWAQEYEQAVDKLASSLVDTLAHNGQQRGTVMDFTDLQGMPTELGRFLSQELSDQFINRAKGVAFIDRANVMHILEEHKLLSNLSSDGFVNPKNIKNIGNLVGVDTLIVGTVTPLAGIIRLSVRAISTETGTIVAAQSISIPETPELRNLQDRAVSRTASDMPAQQARDEPTKVNSPKLHNRVLRVVPRRAEVSNYSWSYYTSDLSVSFDVENISGYDLWVAIYNTASGINCGGGSIVPTGLGYTGLPTLGEVWSGQKKAGELMPHLAVIPAGGAVTVQYRNVCKGTTAENMQELSLPLSFIVAMNDEVFLLTTSSPALKVNIMDSGRVPK